MKIVRFSTQLVILDNVTRVVVNGSDLELYFGYEDSVTTDEYFTAITYGSPAIAQTAADDIYNFVWGNDNNNALDLT